VYFENERRKLMAKKKTKRPEAHRICNVVSSRNTEDDWSLQIAIESNAIAAPPARTPSSVDLREDWWDIGDQESTGSCVGWASTDGVVRYHMVRAGRLPQDEHLSPRCTWMASKETDEFTNRPETFIEAAGTSLKAAMDVLRRYGSVLESLLPFHITTNMYAGDGNAFYANAASRRIASYFNLQKDFRAWRTWLTINGPIMAGLLVDATWDNAKATNGNLDTFQPRTVRGGHAVCIVGYTTERRFIVRNSWGTNWGDKGFAYASEAYIRAAFFNESYGATV
jgi:C1A family cysteine protease